MRGFGLGFTNPVGTGGVRDMCLCLGCGGVDGVMGVCCGAWTMVWVWEGMVCHESGFFV